MDLKRMFGDKYLVTLDESWDAETPENRAEFLRQGRTVRYCEIKGRCGTVYPYSGPTSAVSFPPRRRSPLDEAHGFRADASTTCR